MEQEIDVQNMDMSDEENEPVSSSASNPMSFAPVEVSVAVSRELFFRMPWTTLKRKRKKKRKKKKLRSHSFFELTVSR